jgi:hypothetical protein
MGEKEQERGRPVTSDRLLVIGGKEKIRNNNKIDLGLTLYPNGKSRLS